MVGEEGFEALAGSVLVVAAVAGGGDDVGGGAFVEVGVAVVGFALQLSAGFVGDTTRGMRDDVVDVAVDDRGVAAGGVLAMAVADLDRSTQHPAKPA